MTPSQKLTKFDSDEIKNYKITIFAYKTITKNKTLVQK